MKVCGVRPRLSSTRPGRRSGSDGADRTNRTPRVLWQSERFSRPRQGVSLAPALHMTITASPPDGRFGDRNLHNYGSRLTKPPVVLDFLKLAQNLARAGAHVRFAFAQGAR